MDSVQKTLIFLVFEKGHGRYHFSNLLNRLILELESATSYFWWNAFTFKLRLDNSIIVPKPWGGKWIIKRQTTTDEYVQCVLDDMRPHPQLLIVEYNLKKKKKIVQHCKHIFIILEVVNRKSSNFFGCYIYLQITYLHLANCVRVSNHL